MCQRKLSEEHQRLNEEETTQGWVCSARRTRLFCSSAVNDNAAVITPIARFTSSAGGTTTSWVG